MELEYVFRYNITKSHQKYIKCQETIKIISL